PPPTDGTEQLCLVAKSPYRILRCAAAGNLKRFQELHSEDPSCLVFRDAQRGRTCAHYAAAADKVEIIKYIVLAGGDINITDNDGQTPLHAAVESSSLEAIKCLLEWGAATDCLDASLRSPFHLAVWLDRPQSLRLLAQHRRLVRAEQLTEHGRDALHVAAVRNHAQCAEILLEEFQMLPDRFCKNGFSPVHEAARRASFDTMLVLTRWAARTGRSLMQNPDSEGNLPLHLAVHSGDVKMVELCLQRGADITNTQSDLSTPVHLACVQGSMEITQLMLRTQSKDAMAVLDMRDSADMTPLHCAAKFDHSALVEFLHSKGADLSAVDSEERTPLLLAASRSSWSAVTTLVSLGSALDPIDKRGRNMVHYIVLNGGRLGQLMDCKLESMASVAAMLNRQDGRGYTPLHFAARDGHLASLRELIEQGACTDIKNASNESPLHCAARFGRYYTVECLLSSTKGQQIMNGIDSSGRTPLHIASQNGHLRVVQLLIGKGALLNRDFEGLTPLHLATRRGFTQTMNLLLGTHSQLLDQRDKAGNTALHLACLANRPSAAGLLLSMGCEIAANGSGYTALDICIKHKLTETARVLLTTPTASTALLADTQGKNKYIVAALIDVMPNIMKTIMDKHIVFSNCKRNDEKFTITYDLSLFEPNDRQVTAIRKSRGDNRWKPRPLTAVNHMVRHGRIELLMHPLTQKYLAMKWQAYGRICHMLSMLLYAVFVALVTAHGVHLLRLVQHCPALLQTDGYVSWEESDGLQQGCENSSEDWVTNGSSITEQITMIAVIIFGVLNVLKKMMQMWNQGWAFLIDFENYLELSLYMSALFSVTPVFHPVVHHVYVIAAAIAVFLAWFNMLLYLRSFESVGIYVVMFVEIQKTLLRVLVIFSVLIIAFGLAFYILMSQGNHPEFSSVPVALSRTFNMMLGEIDFLSVYVYPWLAEPQNGTFSTTMPTHTTNTGTGRRGARASPTVLGRRFLPFANTAFLLVIVFMVMMPILLMNLLVGLAVGDIETVRKNAALKRLAMQVDLHTALERKLPDAFLARVRRTQMVEYPNVTLAVASRGGPLSACHKVFHFVMELLTPSHDTVNTGTFDHLEAAVEDDEYRQQEDLAKLKQRLKEAATVLDSVHHLMRQVAAQLDLAGTEARDEDEGDALEPGGRNSPAATISARSTPAPPAD
ncbi:transient receptor potential cation channel subfamily A member 1-like, partial [Amphibalanus amphitrite]|uniref:transient receptor potential cation channel subfamily A member 1-like n=1 Tax=Amphibalanus amphitrite TaxID=1232801 RepID=UPI001C922FAE